jgi:SHS2 domain-containing protein
MEVEGKTIRDVAKNLIKEINDKVNTFGEYENFSTKFEVKGKDIREALENLANKIVSYFEKKNAIFEELEIEVVPLKKWVLRIVAKGKVFEDVKKDFREVKISRLEESESGWKLEFSLN